MNEHYPNAVSCAYCEQHYYLDCKGCPLEASRCIGTPYDAFIDAMYINNKPEALVRAVRMRDYILRKKPAGCKGYMER